ncbi:MAG: uracil-DNA glycosylase [Phycicoccus sp.]
MDRLDPHPVTGQRFTSPAPPGTGWPGDPASPTTPVARSPGGARRLAAGSRTVPDLQARISVCRACPRLVEWRESVARTGRRSSFAGQPYWGRPGPSFGDADSEVLLVGLAPAANGTNRTGRMFTGDSSGDFLYAALHRTGFASRPTSVAAGDGQALHGIRIVAAVRCAPPGNQPTGQERASCAAWLRRDLELAAPRLRAVLCLGGLAGDAALGAVRGLGWEVPTPRPRFGHAAEVAVRMTPARTRRRPRGGTAGSRDPSAAAVPGPPRTAAGHPREGTRVIRVVGSYHVSPHNTFTGRLTPSMLDDVLRSVRA